MTAPACRAALVAALFVSPTAAPAADEHEFFEKNIRPLLAEHCLKCHGTPPADGGSKTPGGGLKLTSRAEVLKGGDSGAAVVPGKPDESLLV
ncbi:MAG: hypothetical protein K2V38_07595, partial [Gemmataceae bacterium]|nr:hypothetical protein [Gemmataceae bacterium]